MNPIRKPFTILATLALATVASSADQQTSVADSSKMIQVNEMALASMPPELRARWDAMLRKHPELKNFGVDVGRNPHQSGSSNSSHCKAIINGKEVYSGPGSSISATSTNDGGKEHQQVIVDGKVVKGF